MIQGGMSIEAQIEKARFHLKHRYNLQKFIAYFQSFSNTHADVSTLKSLWDQALSHEDVVGLSVATRPDCVNSDNLALLASYRKDRLVWIELGLQSAHDKTLARINRGHDAACFERSVWMAREYSLDICAHVILGLPGEDRDMMLRTARFLGRLPIQGIKIHLLYITKGTPLTEAYYQGEFRCLEQDEYVSLVVDFLERLPAEVVVQRLTGDPQISDLIAPTWACEKSKTLNLIQKTFENRNTRQGKKLNKPK
jgi:uncharacterized protein